MATNAIKVVNSDTAKVKQANPRSALSPIRVKSKTRSLLDDLLKRANKSHVGRRIKADDVICYALNLVCDDHLADISQSALTNKDRLEMLFKQAQRKNRNLSRDSFYGLLLKGRLNPDIQP